MLVRTSVVVGILFALGGCTGPKYPKCEKDEHCADKKELCVEGSCQECRAETDCGDGRQCAGGRCEAKAECGSDAQCTNNQVCRTGKCQTECAADGDCGSSLKCKAARCVDKLACDGPSDCGGGPCSAGRCATTDNVSRGMCATAPAVRFGFNDSELTEESRRALSDYVPCLKDKKGKITIEGHADERGTEEFNLALADRRARTVMKYLSTLGLTGPELDVISKGELDPEDSGQNEAAWSKNRRAKIIER